MKNVNLIHLFVLLITLSRITDGIAQQCEQMIFFQKGANYEMESYNGKDKKQSKIAYTVKDISSDKQGTTAKVHTAIYDNKDKLTNETELKMICSGDKIMLDMSEMFKSIQSKSAGGADNFEIDIQGSMIEIPKNMTIGQSLPDMVTTMILKDKSSKNEMMKMTITTSQRIVEAKEKLTTPAGTFDTYKISYQTFVESAMMMMDMKLPSHTLKGILYFSDYVGMVKTVELDKKGEEVKSYTLLTKYSK
ncbi:MAG: hypothetical protein EAZ07_06865 [Cytophagales bacterium]|nr:MAG: hypothetical protein EAZ07_06865 [Cytophagales bacterium]